MAKKKRQGPATGSNATLIEAPLPLSSIVHATRRLDDKGHEDEQIELLATSANAGEGENCMQN